MFYLINFINTILHVLLIRVINFLIIKIYKLIKHLIFNFILFIFIINFILI